MTRQTPAPLAQTNLNASTRRASELARSFRNEFGLVLDPPYQRGEVWTEDQETALIRSLLTGIPTGTVIISDRANDNWRKTYGSDPFDTGEPVYAVIDGKQRLTTVFHWFDGELAVPATWFEPAMVETAEDTGDGPYVRFTGLTKLGQRVFEGKAHLQVAETKAASVAEEAAIYLLVNGGGTPQTSADMTNAQHIATGPCTVAWHAHPDGQYGDTCRYDQPA